jgi:hypothetical protein
MTGKRLLKRLVTVFVGMLCFFMFLHAVEADAKTAIGHRLSAVSQSSAKAVFYQDAAMHRR